MHACRCASNGTLSNLSSGALAFGRDMYLDIPLIADILTIQKHRQGLIDKRLLKANARRLQHDYAVGDSVYKRNVLSLSDKLRPTFSGPYTITRVYTNSTVELQLSPHLYECIKIRRIKPRFALEKGE
ncbi:hypothetical protein SEMRO_531_G161360.1 [Seminavis robusta]|uniref:Uncharacterized protein n=1 Tax=Seminavis robusta TaxID=568900 RepID=A0A9N8HFM5_9STRA|nr:hypothetical protein SEMRO_531_G161360.1 [Seminavis robusta]|eukprot:Sro531_g161360.1 n/a (128) ;mRNA; r:41051-41434